MQIHMIWRPILIMSAVLVAGMLLAGCNKEEPEETSPDASANLTPDLPPRVDTGFIPEATLSDSPFRLDGRTLGTGMAEVQAGWDASGQGYQPLLDPDTGTGSLASETNPNASAGEPFQEYAFFESGELVGFQQLIDMDTTEFDARVAELTEAYGEPVEVPPSFMNRSDLYLDALEQDPARLVVWADTATRTTLIGSLSQDGQHSMWAVFHPEGYDAAQFSAIGVSGS